MFGESLVRAFEGLLAGVGMSLNAGAASYCRLEGIEGRFSLVASDSSQLTFIRVVGRAEMTGPDEFSAVLESLDDVLRSAFEGRGHAIQWVYRYNPDQGAVNRETSSHIANITKTMTRLGLDMNIVSEFADDWAEALSPWCIQESNYLVVWTRPSYLTRYEKKHAAKEQGSRRGKTAKGAGALKHDMAMKPVAERHAAFVDELVQGLTSERAGLFVEKLDVHGALKTLRKALDEAGTSDDWESCLPIAPKSDNPNEKDDNPPPVYFPDDEWDDEGISMYPNIPFQIIEHEPDHSLGGEVVTYNGRSFAGVLMKKPPRKRKPFNALFRAMLSRHIPWQVSFWIEGDAIGGLSLKHNISRLTRIGSSESKRVYKALTALDQIIDNGGCVVGVQTSFLTWVDNGDTDELRRRVNDLASAVQSWGSAHTEQVTGDPWLTTCATMPGMMAGNPARRAAGPLEDVIRMLPVTRPASVWEKGSFLPRSPDGLLMPYQPISSLQESWLDLTIAPMGGGKSVRLNAWDFAFLFTMGLTRLPWLAKIDIGPSSRGLIRFLQEILPTHLKHKAIYKRLRMEDKYAVNNFDTRLGCETPFIQQMTFLINFVSVLGTEIGSESPRDGVVGLAKVVIRAAYERLGRNAQPRAYTPGLDKRVDEAIAGLNLRIDGHTSWWEIVDDLYEQGLSHEAALAQRFAVPTLSDVVQMLNDKSLTHEYQYSISGEGSQTLADHLRRKLTEAIDLYPIIGKPTRFDIGEAQIISLDLDEVAPKGSAAADRQTVVMYMMARNIVAGQFYDMPEDIRSVPDAYKAYHEKRIRSIREDMKRMDMDEAHRFLRNAGARAQVVSDLDVAARESRKWNLSIGLCTQDLNDIPEDIQEWMNSVYIMGVGTPKKAAEIVERYGMPESAKAVMLNLRKPNASGSDMLVWHKTSRGRITQRQKLTLGNLMLGVLNSTTEDSQLLDRLERNLEYLEAVRLVSRRYPGGVKKEVERRRAIISDEEVIDEVHLIDEIADELVEFHNKHLAAELTKSVA